MMGRASGIATPAPIRSHLRRADALLRNRLRRAGEQMIIKGPPMSVTVQDHGSPSVVSALITAGPLTVRLISEGDRIVASLKDRGPFEPDSLATWARLCAGGGTVLDIGAYTGLYAIAARKLGCHVHAFEPMPFNRTRFKENCRLNGVSDHVNSEAVSDACGEVTITYNPIPFTSGASLIRRRGAQLPIRAVTVDSLNLRTCAAIKVDVERAEPLVLLGAQETLRRCRPTLLVEVLGEEEGKAVRGALVGLGYRHDATLDTRNWLMVPE
jgi:FkbM family methyltransferase